MTCLNVTHTGDFATRPPNFTSQRQFNDLPPSTPQSSQGKYNKRKLIDNSTLYVLLGLLLEGFLNKLSKLCKVK